MAGREGGNLAAEAHQVLRLGGKQQGSFRVLPVIERADADGVSRRDVGIRGFVIENHGKFRIQHAEHMDAVLLPQGKKQLAVAAAGEGISILFQELLQFPEVVDLTIADDRIAVSGKRLHSGVAQIHDGQAVEAEKAVSGIQNTGIVRTAGCGLLKGLLHHLIGCTPAAVTENCTHGTTS